MMDQILEGFTLVYFGEIYGFNEVRKNHDLNGEVGEP